MELTSEKVHDIFMNSLFEEGEETNNYVEGIGVITRVGFHPKRLEDNREAINNLLNELPLGFKKSEGGDSFLNMCNDKNGNQWTSLHQRMDELVTLGLAIGLVSFPLGREMWLVLPGGLPFITIND